MDKLNSQYKKVKKSIQNKKIKLNNIKYSCIIPKCLKCYRLDCILKDLRNNIIFLENYNIYMLNNYHYFIESELLLTEAENLQYEYSNIYSILKNSF
jgi:hypothetical protein